ncbi:MAG: MFS transporter [Propionibacteriaceae bacterium]|nr:MFS transporter [Propionibacteriaceae bacterium]
MSALDPAGTRLPRPVWVLALVGFFVALGFGVMAPVLPIYARLFGVSSFLVGLIMSALSIMRLLSGPGSSWLLRHISPRELVIVGNLLVAVSSFMMGLADSYVGLLLWRAMGGVGSAIYGVAALALVFAATPPQLRGRANSMVGGGFVLGGMAGPALGGLVSSISLRAPFFFYAATLVVAAGMAALLIPRLPHAARSSERTAGPRLGQLLRDRRYVTALALNFANVWQSWGVRTLVIPLFVVDALGLTTTWVGVAFAVSAVAQAACLPLSGWATDKLGRRPTLLFGTSVTALTGAALTWSQSFWVLVLLMCVFAAGACALGTAGQTLLADAVPSSSPGGLAAYQMVGDSGQIIGPLVAGALLDLVSAQAALAVGSGLLLVGAVLAWRLPRTAAPA